MPPPPPPVAQHAAEIAADPDRAAAYARLLHLQRVFADEPPAAAALAAASSSLLPLLLRDALVDDEAFAASALKCLGFTLYHPALVAAISEEMARTVLDCLVQLIMTTRMKAACNLGVWCISVQQLDVSVIEDRSTSLLTAIVHALDNPFGSFSTTFEAVQAIMKLASQISKGMRSLSSIWVPPIYRRLLSTDKPERDMAERCLLKVASVVLPPESLLSREVTTDLEQKLLPCMVGMLDDPLKKVQAVKSWGWFISLLGLSAVNNKPLLNKMLKIPEQMFIDLNPQVQIATVAAWRNLVDVFFPPQLLNFEKVLSGIIVQETMFSPFVELRGHASIQLRKIKLVMVPLCGILSRSCNIAVRSSCLSTWHYLLHKLGVLVNHSSMLEAAFGPVLKIIFSTRLDNQNMQIWSFCINLFHDFISLKIRQMGIPGEHLCTPMNHSLLSQSCVHLKVLHDVQPIKWLPWDINSFDFQLEVLSTVVNPGLLENITLEIMIVVMDFAIQIFRLLLRGIQVEFKIQSANDTVQPCIRNMFKFVNKVVLNLVQKQNGSNCTLLLQFGLKFLKVIMEELDHSLLAFAKYEICLDIELIKNMQSPECHSNVSSPGVRPLDYMEMVSPAVYMTVLFLSVVAQFVGELSPEDDDILALVFCSVDFPYNFRAAVSFMHMQIMTPVDSKLKIKWLTVWNKIAKCLNEQIISYLKLECGGSGYDILYQFLCYPFVVFLSPGEVSALQIAENTSKLHLSVTQDLEVKLAIEVYKSLCTDSNNGAMAACESFLGGFCEYLVRMIDENIVLFHANIEYWLEKRLAHIAILSAIGEVVVKLLDYGRLSDFANQGLKETGKGSAGCRQSNLIRSTLELVSRFMRLSILALKANLHAQFEVTNRVLGSFSNFVGHLVLKTEIVLLFEIISDPLSQWLSLSATLYSEMRNRKTIYQLEKLWLQFIGHLKTSQLITGASFLQMGEPLLQAALNHPHRPISDATASVWRASGVNTNLQHPGCLASKLDELLMVRRKDHQGYSNADDAITLEEVDISRRFAMSTLEKRNMLSNAINEPEENGESLKVSVGLRRKRLKITKYSSKEKEHKKKMTVHPGEVSSRLDTTVSSQRFVERKECRKPELIIEMLKRKR